MRVVFAVFGFARQKQWMFTGISLTVLGLLAFGLFDRGQAHQDKLRPCLRTGA
jgi:uncharacterized membrane protein